MDKAMTIKDLIKVLPGIQLIQISSSFTDEILYQGPVGECPPVNFQFFILKVISNNYKDNSWIEVEI